MSNVTHILSRIEGGDRAATDALLPLVYDELRKLAAARLARESSGQTLDPTALVHEAYLRLVGPSGAAQVEWDSRGHFFAAAAEAMRRILVDRARHRRSLKAGGDRERIPLAEVAAGEPTSIVDLLALDIALRKFESLHPRKAELVKLRYFAGLTGDQAAAALGIAPSTASADWVFAKSWLRLEIDAAQ
jgi:RNA polymerase sigma factor (TIGR02999 family)